MKRYSKHAISNWNRFLKPVVDEPRHIVWDNASFVTPRQGNIKRNIIMAFVFLQKYSLGLTLSKKGVSN